MTLRPTTYTYAELAVSVKRSFGDESGTQLEDGDILRWANEGQQAIVTRNRVLKRKVSAAVVAGTADYTFPSEQVHQVASIELDGSLLPNMTFEDAERRIMADDPNKTETGRPLFWYEWGGEFSLWPKPSVGYTMVLRYTAYPEKLTGTGNQLLAISDKYYTALIDFILLKAYEMDEDWSAAQAKQQAFEGALSLQGQEERTAQDMTYGVIAEVC